MINKQEAKPQNPIPTTTAAVHSSQTNNARYALMHFSAF